MQKRTVFNFHECKRLHCPPPTLQQPNYQHIAKWLQIYHKTHLYGAYGKANVVAPAGYFVAKPIAGLETQGFRL